MIAKGTWPAVAVPIISQNTGEELMCQFGYSGNKGTPQVGVCFEFTAGPNSGDRITWIGYLTENTEERTLQSLRIIGFKGDDLDKFNDQRPDQEVHLVIEHEENPKDGKVYAKVAWVNDPKRSGGFIMSKPMEAKDRRMFAARFKSKLKGMPPVEGTKAERKPRAAAPADDSSNGWSGNDMPDPPKDRDFGPPTSDEEPPF